MKMRYKISLVIVGMGILTCLFVAQSYALWVTNFQQTNQNQVTSGCISVGISDGNTSLNLTNTYPVNDTYAIQNQTPYTFTITNTCTAKVSYTVTLNSLTVANKLGDEFVKFAIQDVTAGNGVPSAGTNLDDFAKTTSNVNTNTTNLGLTNLYKSYIIAKGTLNGGQKQESNSVVTGGGTHNYKLYLWIDEKAGNTEMEKEFQASVKVESNAIQ